MSRRPRYWPLRHPALRFWLPLCSATDEHPRSTPGAGHNGPRRRAADFVEPDASGQVGVRTLKVDQTKVDRLMELVGELNVAKNGLAFLAVAAEEEFGSRALSRRIKDQYAGSSRRCAASWNCRTP